MPYIYSNRNSRFPHDGIIIAQEQASYMNLSSIKDNVLIIPGTQLQLFNSFETAGLGNDCNESIGDKKDGQLHGNNDNVCTNGNNLIELPITLPVTASDQLSIDILNLFEELLPTEESYKRRLEFVEKIRRMLKEESQGHDVDVHLFGSSVNDLGTLSSDVDLCITTTSPELKSVQNLAKILKKHNINEVVTVPKAKVPIVRLWDSETRLACDMNINNTLALHNTRLIKTYVSIDQRVRPLTMIVRHWAAKRVLNDAAKGGTLSTYTWTCMVLNFLQMREPPILPVLHQMSPKGEPIMVNGENAAFCEDVERFKDFGAPNRETLGGLLFAFFRRFAYEFDYQHHVISLRHGKYLTKESKGWHVGPDWRLLCVEEPFNTSRNLGNSADIVCVYGLIREFRRACNKLYENVSLDLCCEQYIPPKGEYGWYPGVGRGKWNSSASGGMKKGQQQNNYWNKYNGYHYGYQYGQQNRQNDNTNAYKDGYMNGWSFHNTSDSKLDGGDLESEKKQIEDSVTSTATTVTSVASVTSTPSPVFLQNNDETRHLDMHFDTQSDTQLDISSHQTSELSVSRKGSYQSMQYESEIECEHEEIVDGSCHIQQHAKDEGWNGKNQFNRQDDNVLEFQYFAPEKSQDKEQDILFKHTDTNVSYQSQKTSQFQKRESKQDSMQMTGRITRANEQQNGDNRNGVSYTYYHQKGQNSQPVYRQNQKNNLHNNNVQNTNNHNRSDQRQRQQSHPNKQKLTQSNGQNRRNNQQLHKQNQNHQGQRRLSYSIQHGNNYAEHNNRYHTQQQKEGVKGNEQGAYVVYNTNGCESNHRHSNNFDQNNNASNIQDTVYSHSHTPSLNEQKQHYGHNTFPTTPFQTQTLSAPPKRPYSAHMPFHDEQRTPQMSTPSVQTNQRSNETDEPSISRRRSGGQQQQPTGMKYGIGKGEKSTNENNGREENQLFEQWRANGNNGNGNSERGNMGNHSKNNCSGNNSSGNNNSDYGYSNNYQNPIHSHSNPSTHVHTNTYTNAPPSLTITQTHPSSSAQGTNYKQVKPALHPVQPPAYSSTSHPTSPIYFSPRPNPSTTSPSSAAPVTSTTYVKARYVLPSVSYPHQEDLNGRNGDNGNGNGIAGPNTNAGGKRKNVDNMGKKGNAGEKKNGIVRASEKERDNNFENGVCGQRQHGQSENGRQQQMGNNTGGNKNKKRNQWSHNKNNNSQNNYYNNVTQNKVNVASNLGNFAHGNHNELVYIPTGSTFSYSQYPVNNSVQADVNVQSVPNNSPYEVSGNRYNGNDGQGIQKGDINHSKKQDRGNGRVAMNQRDVYNFGRRGNNANNSNNSSNFNAHNSAQSFCQNIQQFAPDQHMPLHLSSARNSIIDDNVDINNNASSDHQSAHTEDVFVNSTADSSRMVSLAIANGRRHNNNGQGGGRPNEHNDGNQPRGQGTEGKSKRRAKKNARNGSAQKNSIRRDETSTSQSSLHSNGNYISYPNNAIKKPAPYHNNNNNFSKTINKNATNSPSYARSQPTSLIMMTTTNNTQPSHPFTTPSVYNNMTSNQFTHVQSSNSTSSNTDSMSSNAIETIGQSLNQSYGRGGRGARNAGNRRASEQK